MLASQPYDPMHNELQEHQREPNSGGYFINDRPFQEKYKKQTEPLFKKSSGESFKE